MYIIAIDGGGTKTVAVLADKDGKILRRKEGGPSVWRNVGMRESVKEINSLIKEVKGNKEIETYCITLAGIEEERKGDKEDFVKKLREEGVREEVVMESDQSAAFRAGTEERDGVVVICGTGAVARGWRRPGVVKASGWGYLADEGGAFYTGIEGFRAVQKSFDRRGKHTEIENIICKEWNVASPEEVNGIVYSDFKRYIPSISTFVGRAGDKGDEVARNILEKGAREMALSAKTVIKGLDFTKDDFPLVVVGGMFGSKTFTDIFEKEISSFSPKARIIKPEDPVKGAVKLALERINNS